MDNLFKLKVLFQCVFFMTCFPLCATNPETGPCSSVTAVTDESYVFKKNSHPDFFYHGWTEEKENLLRLNLRNQFYQGNLFFRCGYDLDWIKLHGNLTGLPSDNGLRRSNFQGIGSNMIRTYAYEWNFRSMAENYRRLLLRNLSGITGSFLEDSSSGIGDVGMDYFGCFYRSLSDLFHINLGRFGANSSWYFDLSKIKYSYRFLNGTISSTWNIDQNKIFLKIRIPLNSTFTGISTTTEDPDSPNQNY